VFQQIREVNPKDLSAPELLVLLNPSVEAREVLKVGCKELLAMGLVRLEKSSWRGWLGVRMTGTNLRPGPGERPRNPVLYGLLGDLRSACRHGTEIGQVLQQLRSEYGQSFQKFKEKLVLPGLLRQGLLEEQPVKVLGLFESRRYRQTAAGLALKQLLEGQMAQARQAGRLLRDDPQQVVALVASLGSAAILVPELWPYFGEINARLRQRMDNNAQDPDEASLDSLEQAFAEVDSSFDAADGGGDGGGGDGGI
jgi:hypothetical protein